MNISRKKLFLFYYLSIILFFYCQVARFLDPFKFENKRAEMDFAEKYNIHYLLVGDWHISVIDYFNSPYFVSHPFRFIIFKLTTFTNNEIIALFFFSIFTFFFCRYRISKSKYEVSRTYKIIGGIFIAILILIVAFAIIGYLMVGNMRF